MVSDDALHEKFMEFLHPLENGSIVVDAVLVMAYVEPEEAPGRTLYGQASTGGPIHRLLGLLDIAHDEMLRGE